MGALHFALRLRCLDALCWMQMLTTGILKFYRGEIDRETTRRQLCGKNVWEAFKRSSVVK